MGAGRPTDYREEYAELARNYCLLGATDKDLAAFFDVDESTINNWKLIHTEFLESLKEGKETADARVAQALYHRAIGYSHPQEEIKVVSIGDNQGSQIERVDTVKHYPPDSTSCIFWLKNRQPEKWREKPAEEGEDASTAIPIHITIERKSGRKDNDTDE